MKKDLFDVSGVKSLFPDMKYKSVPTSFSISADIKNELDAFCVEHGLNKSRIVNKLLDVYLTNAGARGKKA